MRRHLRKADGEGGFVYVWFALVITLLLAVSAFVIDLMHGYSVAQEAQNAADAAALAGVQDMPDFNPGAQQRAIAVGDENIDGATIQPSTAGLQPNQLRVNVRKEIDTFFGRFVNKPTLTINRTSVAEYDPPVRMGSSRSTFGNCGPACAGTNFWAQATGPLTSKHSGNAGMARYCDVAGVPQIQIIGNWLTTHQIDNCDAGTGLNNDDYSPNGQNFVINYAGTGTLSVDVFDPVFVDVNTNCTKPEFTNFLVTNGLSGGRFTPGVDPQWCTGDADPRWQTPAPSGTFPNLAYTPTGCTGSPPACNPASGAFIQQLDYDNAVRIGNYAVDTTFQLFMEDDTAYDASDNSVPACGPVTFQGYADISQLFAVSPSLDGWREWESVIPPGCNITTPGQYVLRVTTAANTQGNNQFAIRGYTATGLVNNDPNVRVYASQWMSIYTNSSSNTGTFELARVLPSTAPRTLLFSFFDIGDAQNGQTVEILAAAESTTPLTNCESVGLPGPDGAGPSGVTPWRLDAPIWGTLDTPRPGCSIAGLQATATAGTNSDAQWLTVAVRIPETYTCDDTVPTGCWLRIRFTTTAGRVSDVSTWSARMDGLPVRIVE